MKSNIITAEQEYSKDPNLKKEDIAHLKSWIEKQPHLPNAAEVDLIHFYHASEYSLQKTKELLEIHYTFRTDAPEFYPTPEYQPPRYNYNVWDICYIVLCPKPTPEGYRIIYCGLRDTNPSKYHFEIALAMFIRMMSSVEAEGGLCPGYVFIYDIAGITLQHLATVSVSLVKKFLYFVQDGVPVKVKAVHMINVTSIIDKIMFLIKPFIKKALFDMLYFHSDMEEFYKAIPKECLPCDLGGTSPSRNELLELTRQKVERCKDYLDDEWRKNRSNEGKRTNSTMHNRMEGSFKKIEID